MDHEPTSQTAAALGKAAGGQSASAAPVAPHSDAAPAIRASLDRLIAWLRAHDYAAYDTFDGLSAWYLRPFTLERKFPRQVLQQAVRRFPINLRPLLGIPKRRSTKGQAFIARGFLRLAAAAAARLPAPGASPSAAGEQDARAWEADARASLDWLLDHPSRGYSGLCWGNHFDYQSRGFYLPKDAPTVVWTSLIGLAFLDGYRQLGDRRYLDAATSACRHIQQDLQHTPHGAAVCINYIVGTVNEVHNANVLGAALLAETYRETGDGALRDLARRAAMYTAERQLPDGAWYYGEAANVHWIDNFHTAYVLDSLRHYADASGDGSFNPQLERGYHYWKQTFFLPDGTPRYYHYKTLPLDIQCASQAIDTLVYFSDRDPEALDLAVRVARWTIANMQDRSGYFYYRRYSRGIVNRTPTLHWGQATMLSALAALLLALSANSTPSRL